MNFQYGFLTLFSFKKFYHGNLSAVCLLGAVFSAFILVSFNYISINISWLNKNKKKIYCIQLKNHE